MLVLSRKLGEKIIIGDNIVVTVVKIDRNQIRLGIEAPQSVPVYREEIAPGCLGSSCQAGISPGQTVLRAPASRRTACSGVSPAKDRHPAIGSGVTGPS